MNKLKRILSLVFILTFIFALVISPLHADDTKVLVKGKGDIVKVGDKVRISKSIVSELKSVKVVDGKTIQTWEAKISGLPETLDDLETPIATDWVHNEDGTYSTGINLFNAVVNGNNVKVTYNGKSQDWTPRLMVGGNEDIPSSPTLIKDLINENYNLNTIAWYYHSCTRYLRVIEGSIQESYVFYSNPNAEVNIFDNIHKDYGFNFTETPSAFDAKGNNIKLTGDKGITQSEFNRTDIEYPVTIDPTTSFTTSASDGYLWLNDDTDGSAATNWSSARTTSTAEGYSNTSTSIAVGFTTFRSGTDYFSQIYRPALYFDTSTLSAYTITGANIWFYCLGENTEVSSPWSIVVTNGQPTYPHDPMVVGDYNYSNYSGNGGTLSTSSITVGQYNTLTLSATGYGWINKTGTTKLMLKNYENDYSNSTPTYTNDGVARYNSVVLYSYEQGTGYQPYLSVTYTALAPTITVNSASNVANTSARLNATVTSDGGDVDACTVEFGYGTTSQSAANYNSYTTKTSAGTTYSTGDTPYLDVSGLSTGTPYYYRVKITNSVTSVVSTDEMTFTTTSSLNPPSSINGSPTTTTLALSWSKGAGSTNTLIRYRLDTYPTTTSDGTSAYENSDNTYTITGLTSGTTYHLSFWGGSGGDYSASYTTFDMTTLSEYGNQADTITSMGQPSNFNIINPDYTKLSLLDPLYSGINAYADGWGMQRGSMWLLLYTFFMVLVGALLVVVQKPSIAIVVEIILMVIGNYIGLVSGWWILFGVLIFAGLSSLRKRED